MAQSLAVRYRPKNFDEMLAQKSVIQVLKRQLETNQISHTYLFCGSSGCGKTTTAYVLAKAINKGVGSPIEIDAASNSGVDNVRQIITDAKQRSIDSEYKIFIIDEAHALTSTAWQAFLKCIEEPPEYTIFIFCTTNPEKVPETIQNRCMRFNITKVPTNLIYDRLCFICKNEGFINYEEACDYISKISNGGVRDAIATLEKCAGYSIDLRIENILECLGAFSYNSMFDLTGAIFNCDEGFILSIVDQYYNAGTDLNIFIEQYLDFVIDLTKYCLFKDMTIIKIPNNLVDRCSKFALIPDSLKFVNMLVDKVLEIKNMIKRDANCKTTIEAMFIKLCREN